MKLTIGVDYGNGPVEVTVSPFAVIGWEKDNRTKVSRLAADGIGYTDLADLAWRQLNLDGRFPGSLDEFERKLVTIEPVSNDPS